MISWFICGVRSVSFYVMTAWFASFPLKEANA